MVTTMLSVHLEGSESSDRDKILPDGRLGFRSLTTLLEKAGFIQTQLTCYWRHGRPLDTVKRG